MARPSNNPHVEATTTPQDEDPPAFVPAELHNHWRSARNDEEWEASLCAGCPTETTAQALRSMLLLRPCTWERRNSVQTLRRVDAVVSLVKKKAVYKENRSTSIEGMLKSFGMADVPIRYPPGTIHPTEGRIIFRTAAGRLQMSFDRAMKWDLFLSSYMAVVGRRPPCDPPAKPGQWKMMICELIEVAEEGDMVSGIAVDAPKQLRYAVQKLWEILWELRETAVSAVDKRPEVLELLVEGRMLLLSPVQIGHRGIGWKSVWVVGMTAITSRLMQEVPPASLSGFSYQDVIGFARLEAVEIALHDDNGCRNTVRVGGYWMAASVDSPLGDGIGVLDKNGDYIKSTTIGKMRAG